MTEGKKIASSLGARKLEDTLIEYKIGLCFSQLMLANNISEREKQTPQN